MDFLNRRLLRKVPNVPGENIMLPHFFEMKGSGLEKMIPSNTNLFSTKNEILSEVLAGGDIKSLSPLFSIKSPGLEVMFELAGKTFISMALFSRGIE